jgi:hypothetical protein
MLKKIALFVGSLFVALVPYGENLDSWEQLKEVNEVFAFLGIIGAVLLAWLGQSPLKPK